LVALTLCWQEETRVGESRFTEEQDACALRQAEVGTPVGDCCRQLRIAEATFYVWKKKHGQLGVTELRKTRMLEKENARVKRPVADLASDRHILQQVLRRKPSETDPPPKAGPLDSQALRDRCAAGVSAGHVAPLGLVSAPPCARSGAVADPGAGAHATAVRSLAHSRPVAPRTPFLAPTAPDMRAATA